MIRVDNGPECISNALALWCQENDVTLAFIEPGKPTQNAYIERFNRTLRVSVLNAFETKPNAEAMTKLAKALDTTVDFLMNGTIDDIVLDARLEKELISRFKQIKI